MHPSYFQRTALRLHNKAFKKKVWWLCDWFNALGLTYTLYWCKNKAECIKFKFNMGWLGNKARICLLNLCSCELSSVLSSVELSTLQFLASAVHCSFDKVDPWCPRSVLHEQFFSVSTIHFLSTANFLPFFFNADGRVWKNRLSKLHYQFR